MKEQLLNEGLTATEIKQQALIEMYKDRCDTRLMIILLLFLGLSISICVSAFFINKSSKMEYSLNRAKNIISSQEADLNEMTYNIDKLIKKTK